MLGPFFIIVPCILNVLFRGPFKQSSSAEKGFKTSCLLCTCYATRPVRVGVDPIVAYLALVSIATVHFLCGYTYGHSPVLNVSCLKFS